MATTTTNFGLKKPAETDPVLIEDMNANMDKIDLELNSIETNISLLMTATVTNDLNVAYAAQPAGTSRLYYNWVAEINKGWPINYPGGYCTCQINKLTTSGYGFAIAVMGDNSAYIGRYNVTDNGFIWRKITP